MSYIKKGSEPFRHPLPVMIILFMEHDVNYYPVSLKLSGRKCVVIGGGTVAERKVISLLNSEGDIEIISPSITENLTHLLTQGKIKYINREYEKGDLKGAFLVISATDSSSVNKEVYEESRELGIMVNMVDNPSLCDFIVPSYIKRGPLVITVSTSGKSPALTKKIRKELEKFYPEEYEIFINMLGDLRERIKKDIKEEEKRKTFWNILLESNILELFREGRKKEVEDFVEEIYRMVSSE